MNETYSLPDGYKEEGNSLWGVDKEGAWIRLTSNTLIKVVAHLRSPDQSGWGRSCIVTDLNGAKHNFVIQNVDLMSGGKNAVRTIVDNGLIILPGREKEVVSFLLLSSPEEMNTRVISTGWIDSEDNVFTLPNEVIGAMSDGSTVVYQPEQHSKTAQSFVSKGTLHEWKQYVAELAKGNQLLIFGILAAISGCLFKLLGIDGAGWNVHGHSSRGKTTWLCVGSSVWGNGIDPAIDSVNSFTRRWNSTGNALEAIAAAHCDSALCLDELGGYPGNSLDRDIYVITGGQGKASLTSSRAIRQTRYWRGNCLSTGEKSFKTTIIQSGKQFMAGQMLRMVDIHVLDVLPNPPEGLTAAEFAVKLKTAAATYHGTAGPAIVKGLIEVLDEDRDYTLQEIKDTLDESCQFLTPENATPEQGRVYQRLAAIITAGKIGIDLDVLPYSIEEVEEAVLFVRDLWLSEHSSIADTDRSIVALQQYLIRNHASFPSTRDPQAKGGNVRAFWDPDSNAFLFTDDQFLAAIDSGGAREVAGKLRQLGYLITSEVGRNKTKFKIASAGDRWIRFYAVKASILEADFDQSKPEVTLEVEEVQEEIPFEESDDI